MINDLSMVNRSESSIRITGKPMRPMSASAIRPRCVTAKRPSPSLSSSVNFNYHLSPNASSLSNVSNARKVSHIIEKEKLQEQVMQYKIVISQLQRELNGVTAQLKEKDSQMAIKNNEIAKMLQRIETPETVKAKCTNINLIAKSKRECRKIEKELLEASNESKVLKKNIKLTKMNECSIEQIVIKKQLDQMKVLMNNCMANRVNQSKEISDYEKYELTLESQSLIINSLIASLNNELQKEKELKVDIDFLKKKLEDDNEHLSTITKENALLMQTNDSIQQEKKKEINDYHSVSSQRPLSSSSARFHMIINDTSAIYSKRINDLERQAFQYKQEANKTDQIVNQLQAIKNAHMKEKGIDASTYSMSNRNGDNILHGQNDKQLEETKAKTIEIENELTRLKEILKNSKAKEEEYVRLIYDYEDKIKSADRESNQVTIGIKRDNPFYSDSPNNDPIQSQKFTNEQYNQFIFVLFKNFEAKGITHEIANDKIFSSLLSGNDNENPSESIKDLMDRFSTKAMRLLECDHAPDKQRLEILFGALCYHCNSDFNAVSVYFLSLFNYIHFYPKEKEDKLKNSIKNKYNEPFNQLKTKIKELTSQGEYISLLHLKQMIDDTQLGIKDKYVEFLFYLMKQFTDKSASLYDLKLSILYELNTNGADESKGIEREDALQKEMAQSKEDNFTESEQEISSEEYEKLIYDSLKRIKDYLNKEKVSLRKYLRNSIVSIDDSSGEVIMIESLHKELQKAHIVLSDLHLSCLCAKYCVNTKNKALSIVQIENDLNVLS